MHPSPAHLPSMSTRELRAYREELLDLAAIHGSERYHERAEQIARILDARFDARVAARERQERTHA